MLSRINLLIYKMQLFVINIVLQFGASSYNNINFEFIVSAI